MSRFFSRKRSVPTEPRKIRKDPKESRKRVYSSLSRIWELLPKLDSGSSSSKHKRRREGRRGSRTTVQPVETRLDSDQERYGPYINNRRDEVFETIGEQTSTTSPIQGDIEISGTLPAAEIFPHQPVFPKSRKDEDHGGQDESVVVAGRRERRLEEKIEQLQAKLRDAEEAYNNEAAKANDTRLHFEELQHDSGRLQREFQQLSGRKQQLESQTQGLEHSIKTYESKVHDYKQENQNLKDTLKRAEEQMAAYRNDIAKLSNERPHSARDDHYWEQQFSMLFRSVQDWVLKYYLTANSQIESLSTLDPMFQEFLTGTLGSESTALEFFRAQPLNTIQAYIAFYMKSRILEPPLLGLLEESYEHIFRIITSAASSTEELAKWRMLTVKMITGLDEFWEKVALKEQEVATALVTSLEALVPDHEKPKYKPVPRTKKLLAIMQSAGKLAIELQREPSTIMFAYSPPGTLYVASDVTDAEGLREDSELEAVGARVSLPVYPGVVRRGINDEQNIMIVKGKVLVSEPEL